MNKLYQNVYVPSCCFQTFDQLLDFPYLHVPVRRARVVRHLSCCNRLGKSNRQDINAAKAPLSLFTKSNTYTEQKVNVTAPIIGSGYYPDTNSYFNAGLTWRNVRPPPEIERPNTG